MTYGEAMIQAREQATLNKEHFALEVPPCEKKMSYEKLCKYYNDKLFAYWLSCNVCNYKRGNRTHKRYYLG